MIKDRHQKKLAVRFSAAHGMVPFTEVIVRSPTGLEETVVDITDVDVMALDLSRLDSTQRIIFDCKTAAKQSGINRAFWLGGLKAFVRADKAFVIQTREAPDSHKLAAVGLNVNIHSEESFIRYAGSVAPIFAQEFTYLDNMETWDSLVRLGQSQPALTDSIFFASTTAALELSGPKAMRTGLGSLIKNSGELDPKKPAHQLLFRVFTSSFLISLALATAALKDIFQFSMEKENFEQRLRYFLWEGRENYYVRNQLHTAFEKIKGSAETTDYDLPHWALLVELMRSFLDAPEALAPLAYLTKEIAFRTITAPQANIDQRLRALFQSNTRSRQFIFAACSYLVQAAKVPRQFALSLEDDINLLLQG